MAKGAGVGTAPPGLHTAVFPPTTDTLVGLLEPYLREGLERGVSAFVNLAGPRLAAVREALGRDGAAIGWSDTAAWHPSPGRRPRAVHEFIERSRRAPAAPARLVGELGITADCSDELAAEWLRIDAVAGDLLARAPVELVCVYDAGTLPPAPVGT